MTATSTAKATDWSARLRTLRKSLKLSQPALAEKLGISRVWLSYMENDQREVSELIQMKIAALEKGVAGDTNVKGGGSRPPSVVREDAGSKFPTVLDRFRNPDRKPSKRDDCAEYFRVVLDRAELSGDPDNFPAIMARLKKQFPLDEWEERE